MFTRCIQEYTNCLQYLGVFGEKVVFVWVLCGICVALVTRPVEDIHTNTTRPLL